MDTGGKSCYRGEDASDSAREERIYSGICSDHASDWPFLCLVFLFCFFDPLAKKFLLWFLLFIGISLIVQSFTSSGSKGDLSGSEDVVLTSVSKSYHPGEPVMVKIQNNLDQALRIPTECPSEPLQVDRYENGVWHLLSATTGTHLKCLQQEEAVMVDHQSFEQPAFFEVAPKGSVTVNYAPWAGQLFPENGRYRVTLNHEIQGVQKSFPTEVVVEDRGFFSSVTYQLFFRPIFNFLLFLTTVLPGSNFGLAIIALTLIIRLLLLVPSQKALKSQKAMMKIQPELEAIKRKHKGDQQKISLETMELWKKHRVNPIGGCLPLLIQLPILIALFYAVKTGFTPFQGYILYPFLPEAELARVSTDFYGILELQLVNATWLPIFVGLLQFFQMKLSFAQRKAAKKQVNIDEKGIIAEHDPVADLQDPLQAMNKTMLYFMPIMMAFMVATLPSGVGLYLAVSTLFGIAQQLVVNRSDS